MLGSFEVTAVPAWATAGVVAAGASTRAVDAGARRAAG